MFVAHSNIFIKHICKKSFISIYDRTFNKKKHTARLYYSQVEENNIHTKKIKHTLNSQKSGGKQQNVSLKKLIIQNLHTKMHAWNICFTFKKALSIIDKMFTRPEFVQVT